MGKDLIHSNEMSKNILFWRERPDIAAEQLLNIKLSPAQKVIILDRSTHSRTYDILSRASGKCVCESTLVFTKNGIKRIGGFTSEFMAPDSHMSIKETVRSSSDWVDANYLYYGGQRETIRVTTSLGTVIEGTANHRAMCFVDGEHKLRRLDELNSEFTLVTPVGFLKDHTRPTSSDSRIERCRELGLEKHDKIPSLVLDSCIEGIILYLLSVLDQSSVECKTNQHAREIQYLLFGLGFKSRVSLKNIELFDFDLFVDFAKSKHRNFSDGFIENQVDYTSKSNAKVYDLHVPEGNIFQAGGFVNHNTFLNAVTACLEAMLYPGRKVGMLSKTFRQSKYMFKELEKIWHGSEILRNSTTSSPKTSNDQCYLEFYPAPGHAPSLIQALPLGSDGSGIRGARYQVILCDEYAQMDKDIVDLVIMPFLNTKENPQREAEKLAEYRELVGDPTAELKTKPNKFIASSTAFYQFNHLWETTSTLSSKIVANYNMAKRRGRDASGRVPEDFKFIGEPINNQFPNRVISDGDQCIHIFNIYNLPDGWLDKQTIINAKESMDEHGFAMEYLSLFPSESAGFFSIKNLTDARLNNDFSAILEPRLGMKYTMGIDPARESDNFAVTIFEVDQIENQINLVRSIVWEQKPFPYIVSQLRKIIDHYKMETFGMDAGGGGTIVRDMLADPPVGLTPILEVGNDKYRTYIGERKLSKLIQFGNYQWLHDANFNFRAGLEKGLLKIAAPPKEWSQESDNEDKAIDALISECASIVMTPNNSGSRMSWGTPSKGQKKDRYSAAIIGFDQALGMLNLIKRPKKLAFGGWG